jgi:hypothetical protein
MNTEISQLKKDNQDLVAAVKSEEDNSIITKVLYFTLGAAISGLTVYAAHR